MILLLTVVCEDQEWGFAELEIYVCSIKEG